MAEGLILEFEGVGLKEYEAVNGLLGIDMESGQGDWPPGLLFHAGGAKPGGWVVFEVWDSRQAQDQFMNERLGQALEAATYSVARQLGKICKERVVVVRLQRLSRRVALERLRGADPFG